MNLSTATSPISQVRHRCALGENFGGYTEAINPGSQHSRITLEHPKTLQDKCHTHIPPLPPRLHRNPEFTGKTLSRLDPPARTLLSTTYHHSQRSPMEDTHTCLSPPLPDHCEGPLSSNSSFWGRFLILDRASSSYHWPFLPILHQQQSQVPGHRSTAPSSRPLPKLPLSVEATSWQHLFGFHSWTRPCVKHLIFSTSSTSLL